MAPGCQLLWAANSAHRRFVDSLQLSKVLDRAGKLHRYRINAYVCSGPKAPFDSFGGSPPIRQTRSELPRGSSGSRQSASGYAFMSPRFGEALAVQTPDVPQKVA